MFKLLVLSFLLVSCLADPPFAFQSWLSEPGRQARGCANLAEGWRACANLGTGKTLAPHGGDCSLFFYCYGNVRPVCRKCPAGLYFNPQLQVCDWPSNVNCSPRPPHNRTTPSPTTVDSNATVTVISSSTTSEASTANSNTTDGNTTEALPTSVTDTTDDTTINVWTTTNGSRYN